MKTANKENTILPITIDTSTQTPIEIALQIDENGMTTASNLYSFLQLEPKNFQDGVRETLKTINLLLRMKIIFRSSLRKNVIIQNLKQIIKSHLILQRSYQ